MNTATAKRTIVFKPETHGSKTEELPDLNPADTVENIVQMLALTRPELATAIVEGPVQKNDTLVYTVKTQLGHKG